MNLSFVKNWWVNVLLYGAVLGLLLATLHFWRYKWVVFGRHEEWYISLIAVIFAATGIWAGIVLSRKKTTPAVAAALSFQPKTQVIERLGITPRELEVLEKMAEGLSNQEIADRLFVSLNTVKTHSSNLFSKLGVQRRTQAIQQAKSLGLIA